MYLPLLEQRRFSGFKSLCATFISCRNFTAMQMSLINSAASERREKNKVSIVEVESLLPFSHPSLLRSSGSKVVIHCTTEFGMNFYETDVKGRCNYSVDIFQIQQPDYFFIRSKNHNKNLREMGMLSLSKLEICIKKQNSLVLKLKTLFQR